MTQTDHGTALIWKQEKQHQKIFKFLANDPHLSSYESQLNQLNTPFEHLKNYIERFISSRLWYIHVNEPNNSLRYMSWGHWKTNFFIYTDNRDRRGYKANIAFDIISSIMSIEFSKSILCWYLSISTSMGLEVKGNYELCWGCVLKCSADF